LNTIVTMAVVALALAVVVAPRTLPSGDATVTRWVLSGLALILAVSAAVVPVMSLASDYWMGSSGHR
jgi:hypothetical protein